MRTPLPRVSDTRAPASALPVIVVDCSLALTTSSPATREMVGALGASTSTVKLRVPAVEVLPAASVAVAETVSAPSPMAVRSSAVRV